MSEARWIDGPQFVGWLEQTVRGLVPTAELGEDLARRLRQWAEPGRVADVYLADRILTRLGHHLSEVPPEFFRESYR